MGRPTGAKYGIKALREFAGNLDAHADDVADAHDLVANGRVPVEMWGTAYSNVLPDVGNEPDWKTKTGNRVLSGTWVKANAAGIDWIKSAYEDAHDAAVGRLSELKLAYRVTAQNLRWIADEYERSVEEQKDLIRRIDG